MICSLKFKKDIAILKMLLSILSFCFWSYAPFKLLSHFHYGLNSPWASYCSLFYAASAAVSLYIATIFHCHLLMGIFWPFTKLNIFKRADWDGLGDHLRDVPWEDIFKLGASAAASEICEWVHMELMYISLIENVRSSLIHLHGFQLLVLPP